MNNLLYDENSRYNNLDNQNIIFLTPNELDKLDIGFDKKAFKTDELDTLFPFLVDALKEMIKETTIGDINGSNIELPVENSDCKVFICIEINNKLCKLQSEEWDIANNLKGLPCNTQIKVFQRLISEGQIILEDLAIEDIDNNVYKKLVTNDISGVQMLKKKTEFINKLLEEQSKDTKIMKMKEHVLKNL